MKLAFMVLMNIAVVTITSTGSAWAGQLEDRLAKQHLRISQGVSSGALIKSEARKLRSEQKMIRLRIQKARADGILTRKERRHLKYLQDRAGRHIHRLKRNQLVYRPRSCQKGYNLGAMQRGRI